MFRRQPRLYRVATVGRILDLGERAVFKRLRDLGCIDDQNIATTWATREGLMVIEERQFVRPHQSGQTTYFVTLVTSKGLEWLREQIAAQGAA